MRPVTTRARELWANLLRPHAPPGVITEAYLDALTRAAVTLARGRRPQRRGRERPPA